jgi:hypothetical protein
MIGEFALTSLLTPGRDDVSCDEVENSVNDSGMFVTGYPLPEKKGTNPMLIRIQV